MDENNHQNNGNRTACSGRKKKKGTAGRVAAAVLKVLGTLILIGITTSALLACFAAVYIKTVIMPAAAEFDLSSYILGENSVMYYQDRDTGEYKELCTVATTTDSILVTHDELPEDLINATIAIEDKRFREHGGVDWIRTAKAILCMFTGEDIQGGSTLTQQTIKNITQEDDVTVKRKVLEIFRALEVDRNNSKDDIITLYLNVIWMGSGCRGVGSASYEYFGKPVSELSLAECASLISITNNPSIYSPYSTIQMESPNGDEIWDAVRWNKYRQELVLYLMLDQEKITQEEYDAAMEEELVFNRKPGEVEETDLYSWYEEKVLDDVRDDLMEQYGYTKEAANMLLSSGGLKIFTCVDLEIQTKAEAVYANTENLVLPSKSGQDLQSAITIIDNETGDAAAIVGKVGEKEGNRIWSFATDTKRQPGSSIKPLSVYSPAIEMGYITPGSIIDDYPYKLNENGKPWPVNSGAEKYRGLTTIYSALTRSVNTVAVRLIADYVTPEGAYDFLENKYHITTLVDHLEVNGVIKNDYDLAQMALGGLTNGVNTLEMAAAYATFPNDGVYSNPRTYSRVEDNEGNVLLENEKENEPVIKQSTAYYMNYMLKNVVRSGTGTKARFDGMTGIAGKTGTTSDDNDRWFVGYTPYYTAAVWTGYKQPEKIKSDDNPAVRMWKLVMEQVHEGLEDRDFVRPEDIVSSQYCMDSGGIPTDECKNDPRGSRVTEGYFVRGESVPTEFCTLHTAVEVCTDCPILDEEGNETGRYYLAGEFCPAESRLTVSLLNYQREPVGEAVAEDNDYLLSTAEALGTCTFHTVFSPPSYDPGTFNPLNPSTWPTDPGFNIFDPTTWPSTEPEEEDPTQTDTPGQEEPPEETPSPEPTHSGGFFGFLH